LSVLESAIRDIRGMGYEVPVLQKAGAGYYRIMDGTGSVLRISAHINGLISGIEPGRYTVNTTMSMFVFTPAKSRHPEKFLPGLPDPRSSVVDEDVAHEAISNEPSTYAVGKAVVHVKPAIEQIKKTSAITPNGEPVYMVNSSPLFKVLGVLPEKGS